MRLRGFTLIELAVVLAVVGLLLGGLTYTLAAQIDQRNFEDTRRRLEQARELLLAFGVVNGRLPCPARYATSTSHSQGLESFCTGAASPCAGTETTVTQAHGYCSNPFDGFVPAASLGITTVDTSGFATDAWGNRLRYAVTRRNATGTCTVSPPSAITPIVTSSVNLKTYGIACQPSDLLVCRSATGITPSDCGPTANAIMTTSTVVAVIFSTGKNGATGAGGPDEGANLDADAIFVSHPPAPAGAPNGTFDDQFTWLSVGELYGKLISAGVVP
jgi:prepilin-type N-terminal cleavage/methylation domain-containing protein